MVRGWLSKAATIRDEFTERARGRKNDNINKGTPLFVCSTSKLMRYSQEPRDRTAQPHALHMMTKVISLRRATLPGGHCCPGVMSSPCL